MKYSSFVYKKWKLSVSAPPFPHLKHEKIADCRRQTGELKLKINVAQIQPTVSTGR